MSAPVAVGDARPARPDTLRRIARAIGAITFATGATQVVAPAFVLRKIGGEQRPAPVHLFGTIGFFMVVVGGLLARATGRSAAYRGGVDRSVVTWSAVQKVGATTAMAIGVARGVFAPVALLVALFDGLSAMLLLIYRSRIRR